MPSLIAVTTVAVLAVAAEGPLASHDARADERPASANGANANRFALDLGGVRQGFVRATVEADKTTPAQQRLALSTQELAPSLVTLIGTFARGLPVKRDVRLTSGAVVRKANDGKLASVKLPSLGSGGAPEVELGFLVPSISTQPLLSAKEAPPSPSAARISGFRVDLTGMQAIEAPKIDAITITQRPDGSATTGDLAIEVGAGGAPPFVAWRRASAAKPVPRTLRIEYVGADGAAILQLQLDRCTPSAVTPLGASGTTRITLACAGLRGG